MIIYRRTKYVDLIMCCIYGLFLICWYYSRRDISNKIDTKEEEIGGSLDYINSLKEELKIVFRHTQMLEESLKKEQESHRKHYKELRSKAVYFQINLTKFEKEFHDKLKSKESSFQSVYAENIVIKRKHLTLQQRYIHVNKDYKTVSSNSVEDIEGIKQSKSLESMSLQSRVEDLQEQMDYYQTLSLQNNDDYTKAAKKLSQCEASVSHLNSFIHTTEIHKKETTITRYKKRHPKSNIEQITGNKLKIKFPYNKKINQSIHVKSTVNKLKQNLPNAEKINQPIYMKNHSGILQTNSIIPLVLEDESKLPSVLENIPNSNTLTVESVKSVKYTPIKKKKLLKIKEIASDEIGNV